MFSDSEQTVLSKRAWIAEGLFHRLFKSDAEEVKRCLHSLDSLLKNNPQFVGTLIHSVLATHLINEKRGDANIALHLEALPLDPEDLCVFNVIRLLIEHHKMTEEIFQNELSETAEVVSQIIGQQEKAFYLDERSLDLRISALEAIYFSQPKIFRSFIQQVYAQHKIDPYTPRQFVYSDNDKMWVYLQSWGVVYPVKIEESPICYLIPEFEMFFKLVFFGHNKTWENLVDKSPDLYCFFKEYHPEKSAETFSNLEAVVARKRAVRASAAKQPQR